MKMAEIMKEIKEFLKCNEIEYTIVPNVWDTMKVLLRGKFTARNAFIKN